MIFGSLIAAAMLQARPPSATMYYVEALRATRAAQQPASLRFEERLRSQGMKFELVAVKDDASFAIGYGKEMRNALDLHASYTSDAGVSVALDGAQKHVETPIFNPTWSGVEAWMKYGFDGPPPGDAIGQTSAAPSPTPNPHSPKTIAVVAAVDPGAYHIADGGSARCANGAPGHRLLLHALSKPEIHPLTSVVVDQATMRFCTMDFRMGAASGLSFTGAFELHLGAVGSYWLVQDGTADFQVRVLGLSAQHSRIAFAYSELDPFATP